MKLKVSAHHPIEIIKVQIHFSSDYLILTLIKESLNQVIIVFLCGKILTLKWIFKPLLIKDKFYFPVNPDSKIKIGLMLDGLLVLISKELILKMKNKFKL